MQVKQIWRKQATPTLGQKKEASTSITQPE